MEPNAEDQDEAAIAANPNPIETIPGNYLLGLSLGAGACLAGAGIWAFITLLSSYQIGFMAVGVGYVVGLAVNLGKGNSVLYNLTGAVLALVGCLSGNFAYIVLAFGKELQASFFDVFAQVEMSQLFDAFVANTQLIDFLFYALAIYAGWRYSVTKVAQ